jgi:hypothetical protein
VDPGREVAIAELVARVEGDPDPGERVVVSGLRRR